MVCLWLSLLVIGILYCFWRSVHKDSRWLLSYYSSNDSSCGYAFVVAARIVVVILTVSLLSLLILGSLTVTDRDAKVTKSDNNDSDKDDLLIVLLLEKDSIKANLDECSNVQIAQRVADRYHRKYELFALPVDLYSSKPWTPIKVRYFAKDILVLRANQVINEDILEDAIRQFRKHSLDIMAFSAKPDNETQVLPSSTCLSLNFGKQNKLKYSALVPNDLPLSECDRVAPPFLMSVRAQRIALPRTHSYNDYFAIAKGLLTIALSKTVHFSETTEEYCVNELPAVPLSLTHHSNLNQFRFLSELRL